MSNAERNGWERGKEIYAAPLHCLGSDGDGRLCVVLYSPCLRWAMPRLLACFLYT